jgi:hypothetical protein
MPVRDGIQLAETDEEKRAVYRLRYDVYVEEMGRYHGIADHRERTFSEPEDAHSRIFYAAVDGDVVATARMTWGGDGSFSARQTEHYQIEPFLAELAPDKIAVGERAMVRPELRGSSIFPDLIQGTRSFLNDQRVELMFGACEPHLLTLYLGQGSRTYAPRNINSPEAGYLIPIVNVVEDVAYLREIGSPDAETTRDFGADARIPDCVERLITESGHVVSQRLSADRSYLGEVRQSLDELAHTRISALDGLSEEQTERCLGKSNIIECSGGDLVLKKGGVARNMFVVLDGTLEVRDGEKIVRVLSPGDVFGEVAFLLERPRTMDVVAATDGVRILSLSEGTVRQMIGRDPNVAAHLLLNISKILCLRMVQS